MGGRVLPEPVGRRDKYSGPDSDVRGIHRDEYLRVVEEMTSGYISCTDNEIREAYKTKSIRQITKQMQVGIHRVRRVIRSNRSG